ncbi:MAG: PBP1A family penicillin-binding protein [bacterium]|nr:PBP1A family penicillin-binding protein [bacterium]MDZ4284915.1 PBP1A family penicillin-binding protein [Patescibacteria group bacterium]
MSNTDGHKTRRSTLRSVFLITLALALSGTGAALLWAATLTVPDFSAFEDRRIIQSTKIFDRTGKILLFDVNADTKRTVVGIEEVSRRIKNATVAIEDATFYEHKGIRPLAVVRATLKNILSGRFEQGGSTITQQVVKNSILTREKRLARKLKEWILAAKLEQQMSKEGILELYLNEAPYGGSVYGVEEASQQFFGKSARDVTLAEASYLAALPQAPTYYSPYGNHRDALETRKGLVLERMLAEGFITEEERAAALAEEPTFLPRSESSIQAPHFVMYVREYLEQKYGRETIERDGLTIVTTLDSKLQTDAERVVKQFALENKKKFNAENAGLIALDPRTGEILAMVGSRDYFDKEIDGNFNVVLGERQPGSAFKPFVYATAFMKGYRPETVVFDLETEFSTECTPDGSPISPRAICYKPTNYDNVFRGPVSLRNALAQSINVPAVKVLYLAGLKDSLEIAERMGISTLKDIRRYGLTLVLGGGEVTLFDLTSAYGIFANDGVRVPPATILKVVRTDGTVLEEHTPRPLRVLPSEIARTVTNILADNEARTPAFGEQSFLYFPGYDVAAKTGTTNDYRDAWIVGYTPTIAVGAWAGNNDNSPMEKKVAGFIVAPLWHEFINKVLVSQKKVSFIKPHTLPDSLELAPILRGRWQGGVSYVVDKISGKIATDLTPQELREERVVVDPHTILHWVNRENPLGPRPENPTLDPQYRLWEAPVAVWVERQKINRETPQIIPNEKDDVHIQEKAPKLEVQGLHPGAYDASERVLFTVSGAGASTLARAEVFLNGTLIGSTQTPPLSFSLIPADAGALEGDNELLIIGYDSVLNRGEYRTTLSVTGGAAATTTP